MQFKKSYILPAIALLLLGTVLGVQLESSMSNDDTYEQLSKLEKAFVIINRQYVEDVDAQEVAEEGIRSMLQKLDPHSSFIRADDVQEVQETYEGAFGGIGIWFEVVDDTARVLSPITDGPSEQVGVMSGDRIVGIEGESAVGLGDEEIQNRLKGEIGTEVEMTVKRPGTWERSSFIIERDEVPLYSIDNSYLIDDDTGYLRINRFAQTTHDEFMEHMGELEEQGMERLVLDLRNNPGGVMQSAVQIADEFLSEGHTIVKTRGREASMNNEFHSSGGGAFEDKPLIVLVNENSASASEIISGALQDHDRALIVGNRTFGKALVQQQFELDDGSMMQMTVGRYYTPVGRLIQTPYEGGDREDYFEQRMELAERDRERVDPGDYREEIADSLVYETSQGREVFGGGGIFPDHLIQRDPSELTSTILQGGFDQIFIQDWFTQNETELRDEWGNREEDFVDSYAVSQETFDEFWDFLKEEGEFELTTDEEAAEEGDRVFTEMHADREEERIRTYLKGRIAGKLYGGRAATPILNEVDPVIDQAVSLWPQSEDLAAYHQR